MERNVVFSRFFDIGAFVVQSVVVDGKPVGIVWMTKEGFQSNLAASGKGYSEKNYNLMVENQPTRTFHTAIAIHNFMNNIYEPK